MLQKPAEVKKILKLKLRQCDAIVFAWVNDEDTKRAYESGDDAYQVFRKMLDRFTRPAIGINC